MPLPQQHVAVSFRKAAHPGKGFEGPRKIEGDSLPVSCGPSPHLASIFRVLDAHHATGCCQQQCCRASDSSCQVAPEICFGVQVLLIALARAVGSMAAGLVASMSTMSLASQQNSVRGSAFLA